MNKKIFFDLHSIDSYNFVDKLDSLNFEFGVLYSVDVFIVAAKDVIDYYRKRFGDRKDGENDSLFLIKSIPFVIHSMDNRDERLKSLFLDIFVSVSYTDTGPYTIDGETYKSAFGISVSRGGLVV